MTDTLKKFEKCFYLFKQEIKDKPMCSEARVVVADTEVAIQKMISIVERVKDD